METINNILEFLDPILKEEENEVIFKNMSLKQQMDLFELFYNLNLSRVNKMITYNKKTYRVLKEITLEEDIKITFKEKESPNVYRVLSPIFLQELKKENKVLIKLKKWLSKTISIDDLQESNKIIMALILLRSEREKKFKRNAILLDSLAPVFRHSYDKLDDIEEKTLYLNEINTYITQKIKTI